MTKKKLISGISTKVILSFSIVVIIVFVITGTAIYKYNKDISLENSNNLLKANSTIVSQDIDAFFAERGVLVNQMSTNSKIIDFVNGVKTRSEVRTNPNYIDVIKSLKNIRKTDSNIALVYIALEKASYLVTDDEWNSPTSWDISKRKWYWDTIKAGKTFYTAPYVDLVTGKTVVTIAYPIFDNNGKSVAAVAIDLRIDQLPNMMKKYRIGETGYPFLIDGDGLVIYHPDSSKILKQNILKDNGALGAVGKKMIIGESGTGNIVTNGVEKYIAYSPIKSNGWSVGSIITKSEVQKPLIQFNKILFIIYLLGIVFIILVLYVVTKKILKDIPILLDWNKKNYRG